MSSVKNSVQLIGHLGIDPEVKILDKGAKVARIRIATTERYKNKNGEWMEETTWHSVVLWEQLAERTAQNLHKGSHVLIEGKLSSRSYTDATGQKKYVTEVRANNFMLLDKKESLNLVETPEERLTEDHDLPF
ncbi:single-stranded DNA-binding protein [Taibaiella sp. KBW10]|uniref:single-stranded DNA-binding protein n=1 Tax=Taibaiella sp. KBW10 TaxID=2153357 RepID=UPI000F5B16A6|nr:single-stranded DNA-binding protein [Taibaiella sp. KBW10]RQO31765.1 single-stranded DNA-binding protein [Taibaiella sp. KBW10]